MIDASISFFKSWVITSSYDRFDFLHVPLEYPETILVSKVMDSVGHLVL